jgi:hypothetical protein
MFASNVFSRRLFAITSLNVTHGLKNPGTIFFSLSLNFSLDVDKKVLMDRHGILALLRAVAATAPAEIREVEEGVTDFLRRVGTNARLHENKKK